MTSEGPPLLREGPSSRTRTPRDSRPPRPTPQQVCDRTRVPCQRQRGQGEPGGQAAVWVLAPLWGRARERPGAWKGAWGLRLLSKAEEESSSFSQQSAGTPALGKLYLVSPRISPRVCVTVDQGLSGWKQPLQRWGVAGVSWPRFNDDLAQVPSRRQQEVTTRWVSRCDEQKSVHPQRGSGAHSLLTDFKLSPRQREWGSGLASHTSRHTLTLPGTQHS